MNCHMCRAKGRLVTFNTFEYYYCDSCKIEIEDTPGKSSEHDYTKPYYYTGMPTQSAAPPAGKPIKKHGSCLTHWENHDEWLIQKTWD